MDSSNFERCSCLKTKNSFISCQNYTKIHNMIRWKSGKRVDPRLLALLESFEEIYVDRHEFFRRIFHGDHEELFKKIGDALKRKKKMKKARSLPRSLSMRAIGKRGVDDDIDGLKLDRFKIKTPNVIVVGSDDTSRGGQPPPTQSGSNDSK